MAVGEVFSERQQNRVRSVIDQAQAGTGLMWSVLVGDLAEDTRAMTERLHAALPDPATTVLVVVQPGRRLVDVVTGPDCRLSERETVLAVLSMTSSFGGGDLVGGVTTGVLMLAEAAGDGATGPVDGVVNPPRTLVQRLKR